jgi:hypothetical protein
MKAKFKFVINATRHSFGGVVCAGVVMLIASSAQAQNLFVSVLTSPRNNHIIQITPGGAESTFASGLSAPSFLVFEPVPEPSTLGLLAVGAIVIWPPNLTTICH